MYVISCFWGSPAVRREGDFRSCPESAPAAGSVTTPFHLLVLAHAAMGSGSAVPASHGLPVWPVYESTRGSLSKNAADVKLIANLDVADMAKAARGPKFNR